MAMGKLWGEAVIFLVYKDTSQTYNKKKNTKL